MIWGKKVIKIAEDFLNVKLDFLFVDASAMQLILNPSQFDLILSENMFGDILSDAMILNHFELYDEAENIRTAIEKAIELNIATPDLNTTNHFLISNVRNFLSDFILDDEYSFYNKKNIDLGQSTII